MVPKGVGFPMDDHLCLVPIHILSWVVHGPSHPGHGPGSGNHDLAHGLIEVLGLEELPGLHVADGMVPKGPQDSPNTVL